VRDRLKLLIVAERKDRRTALVRLAQKLRALLCAQGRHLVDDERSRRPSCSRSYAGTPQAQVEITQPPGRVEALPDAGRAEADILSVLGITSNELAPLPIQNACTSRVKTMVPLKSVAVLDGLRPDFRRMEAVCEQIGSTGLYPYAPADLAGKVFNARQFPKSSGYPEDAATGIAAAALAFGLLENGLVAAGEQPIRVRQGRAMGRPSEITVRFRIDAGQVRGCWVGGPVCLEPSAETALEG